MISPINRPPLPTHTCTQVSEHFEDSDPLRLGSIGVSQFHQGLSSMRHSDLTQEEFAALCSLYSDPKKKDHVLWKQFVADVDRGWSKTCCHSQLLAIHRTQFGYFPISPFIVLKRYVRSSLIYACTYVHIYVHTHILHIVYICTYMCRVSPKGGTRALPPLFSVL